MNPDSGAGRGAGWRIAFTGLLVLAMAAATFPMVSFGILATFIIDDLGVTRAEVGALIGATSVLAALASPVAGRATDRVGGRTAMLALFALSAAGFVAVAASPVYGAMFAGAALAGLAQSAANPATNKLIAAQLPVGQRGVITGIKQSGVQMGVVIGGLLLPSGAIVFGWRPTLLIVALVPLAALPLTAAVVPRAAADATPRGGAGGPLPAAIWFLAGYGFLLGFAGGVTFLVPLYVEEALGLSPRVGGAAAGVIGFVAIFGRVGWARFAERSARYEPSLAVIAALSVLAAAALYAAEAGGQGLLWVGVVLTGLSSSTWNAVGMLAVMNEAGTERAGRASGIVLFGFLTGLGVGPPLFGWTIDRTGSYATMWVMSIVAAAVATAVTLAWQARSR